MINWFKKNLNKYKEDYQKAIDKQAGFEGAKKNPLYGGTELTMFNGEVLQLTALEALAIDTTTINRTRGVSKERLLSIRDKRDSKSTTKRATFRYNGQVYYTDQIETVRKYTQEEQPQFI